MFCDPSWQLPRRRLSPSRDSRRRSQPGSEHVRLGSGAQFAVRTVEEANQQDHAPSGRSAAPLGGISPGRRRPAHCWVLAHWTLLVHDLNRCRPRGDRHPVSTNDPTDRGTGLSPEVLGDLFRAISATPSHVSAAHTRKSSGAFQLRSRPTLRVDALGVEV